MSIWDEFDRGLEAGRGIGDDIRNGRAYREGGLARVADQSGRVGDLEGMEYARGMQRRQRMFEDQERQSAYERMEQIAPWARNVVRATRNMDPQRAGAFLNRPEIRQRFLDWGLKDPQIDAGIAGLTSTEIDPSTGRPVRELWAEELDAQFQQHQNPEWQISEVTGDIYAADPETGARIDGGQVPGADLIRQSTEAEIALNRRNAAAPYGSDSNRIQYRVLSDAEVQDMGLPPGSYQQGSNGSVSRVGTSAGQLAGAEQRGRIALSFPNIVQAQEDLATLERNADRRTISGPRTPYGQDWGARIAEAVPWDGGSAARMIGGRDYQQYEAASRTFEQSMMPIFSGSAVTESEAQRFVRANLPRLGDTPEALQQKALNRARMINSAATILGETPPYPEAGLWTPSTGLVRPTVRNPVQSNGNSGGLQDLTDEQLDALERELSNGGQ